jgi:DNA-binding Xre family transcriptional regulator
MVYSRAVALGYDLLSALIALPDRREVKLSGPASDTDYRTNPRALKWWRLNNHYSQRDVEEKTGVSYTTISRLENGHRTRARFGTLEKLAQIYGCTIEDLIVIGSQLLA